MNLNPLQSEAVHKAIHDQFSMINGAAGTGKTSLIKAIADGLGADNIALCAFAGKASARLREKTGHEASTIHRLLQYNGVTFMRGSLKGLCVIMDEASMVASDLMAEIIRRNPDKLILVGDQAQLPPVGKGQPFHDLLALYPERVTTLTQCYRNQEAVYHSAMQIREGVMPGMFEESENERWRIMQTGDADRTHAKILEFVRAGAIDFERDIILVPRNGDSEDAKCSVKGLNRDIVDIVNPREEGEKFKVGDRVINGKNFAEKDVWNGTTGTIASIDSEGCAWVQLDIPVQDSSSSSGRMTDKVLFKKDMMKSLSLAYALTVHKAQGSEYRNVLFVALSRDAHSLLDRSLIYTAVTRTQEKCLVVGQKNALWQGIQSERVKRTVIQELSNKGE